jgi:beta-RFAP synthase
MIRVCAPSRLHFGLFALPASTDAAGAWPNLEGSPTLPARSFGGIGLMVERPGLVVTAEPASAWSADGSLSVRALAYAHQAAAALHYPGALRMTIEGEPREHAGLGTGTQLAVAVTQAIAHFAGQDRLSPMDLACMVGRGKRSAIGTHGFAHGGFLVEGGKRTASAIAPLLVRVTFPADWRIVLVVPRGLEGDHGTRETEAFQAVSKATPDLRHTDALCRLVLLGMLPALAERDLDAFGDALYDFNRRVGEMFRPWQGGVYAHPRTAELVRLLRCQRGVRGVGQTSWGPTVFAIVHTDQASALADELVRHHGCHADEVIVTAAASTGAIVTQA